MSMDWLDDMMASGKHHMGYDDGNIFNANSKWFNQLNLHQALGYHQIKPILYLLLSIDSVVSIRLRICSENLYSHQVIHLNICWLQQNL